MAGCGHLGADKIRYLLFINGRWRWRPTKVMRARGFQLRNLGQGFVVDGERVPSADDIATAIKLNQEWDRVRRGLEPGVAPRKIYPRGSLGDGYHRALKLREAERKAKGVVWTKEQESR